MLVYKRTRRVAGEIVEGKYYYYDFVVDGKRYFGSTKHTKKTPAETVGWKVREEVVNGTFQVKRPKKAMTLEKFVMRVLDSVRQRHTEKPRTIEFYEQTFAQIIESPVFVGKFLREIDHALINDYIASLAAFKLRPATVNRRLACLRKALRIAHREKLISEVPHIDMLKGERRREFIFTDEKREEFIAGLPEPTQSFARFMIETGLRVSEICGLLWSDVYESKEGAYLHVRRELAKSGKERFVPLTAPAVAVLESQRTYSRCAHVFVRFEPGRERKGSDFLRPLSRHTVSHQFTRRARMMGLPWDCVLYSLRHTALSNLGRSGANAFQIMAIAGHANVATSQRYVHPVPEEIRAAFGRMERMQNVSVATKDAKNTSNVTCISTAPTSTPRANYADVNT